MSQPKRIPGEPNPEVDGSKAFQLQNASNAAAGGGAGDLGVGAAISALLRWRERRRRRKAEALPDAAHRPTPDKDAR